MSTVIVLCSPVEEPLVGWTSSQSQLSLKKYVSAPVLEFQSSNVVLSVFPSHISPKSCDAGEYDNSGHGGLVIGSSPVYPSYNCGCCVDIISRTRGSAYTNVSSAEQILSPFPSASAHPWSPSIT